MVTESHAIWPILSSTSISIQYSASNPSWKTKSNYLPGTKIVCFSNQLLAHTPGLEVVRETSKQAGLPAKGPNNKTGGEISNSPPNKDGCK